MAMARRHAKPIRESILKLFKSLGMKERFEENLAIAFWDATVGKDISRHTDPQKVVDRILFVKVDDGAWRNELSYLKNELIEKLNQQIGKKAIEEIKFY